MGLKRPMVLTQEHLGDECVTTMLEHAYSSLLMHYLKSGYQWQYQKRLFGFASGLYHAFLLQSEGYLGDYPLA